MQQFDDFAQMQRDAERRVMEMQKRAMDAVERVPSVSSSGNPPHGAKFTGVGGREPSASELERAEEAHPPKLPEASCPALPFPMLEGEDSERALLIIILILLMREGADERLLLALLYILM